MIFTVDKRKQKSERKYISRQIGAKLLVPKIILNIVLFALCVIFFGGITASAAIIFITDETDKLLLIMLAVMFFMLVTFVPGSILIRIRSNILRKYMYTWQGKKAEEIIFDDDTVTYRFASVYWRDYMQPYSENDSVANYSRHDSIQNYRLCERMRYRQILRMEYDEKQHLLRLYGPVEKRSYSDNYKTCTGKIGADPAKKDSEWLEIPEYFNGFEEIKSRLAYNTGLQIENTQRPFHTYNNV